MERSAFLVFWLVRRVWRLRSAQGLFACVVIAALVVIGGSIPTSGAEEESAEKGSVEEAGRVDSVDVAPAQDSSAGDKTVQRESVDSGPAKADHAKEGDSHSELENHSKAAKDAVTTRARGQGTPVRKPVQVPGGDPRGDVDLVVCSQNLKLFGKVGRASGADAKKAQAQHLERIRGLVTRFTTVGCDVIGVQEVIAPTTSDAQEVLEQLASELRRRTNRFFKVTVAPPSDGQMTNGFLLAQDRVTLQQSLPYSRVELPRISKKQRPRLFSRPPLEVQLSVKARDSEIVKPVAIVNFHFKSKRGGKDDPTGMEWETYRMEMSEALRQIVEIRHKESFASGESILLLLGDRNSNFDVASARILEGSLVLSSFAQKGPCRMSKRGVPLCVAETALPRKLFSVLTTNEAVKGLPGTFNYQGEYSWLDDILMPAESLRFAWKTAFSEGEFDSGLVQVPTKVSDHALVYVKLNW